MQSSGWNPITELYTAEELNICVVGGRVPSQSPGVFCSSLCHDAQTKDPAYTEDGRKW